MMILQLAHVPEGIEALHSLPPLHPLFVNFTAALVPASVISDLLGLLLKRPVLHAVGRWALLYAAIITPVTALTGWYWFRTGDHPVDAVMWIHQWLGTALAVVLVAMAAWRWRSYRGEQRPRGAYHAAAVFVLLAMIFQGHAGAVMTFGPGPAFAPAEQLEPLDHDDHEHDEEADLDDVDRDDDGDGIRWREYIDVREID